MLRRQLWPRLGAAIGVLVLAGCGAGPTATPTALVTVTRMAATETAMPTRTAVPPTETAAPTASPAPTATPVPTATLEPFVPAAPYPTVTAGEPIPCSGHDLVYAPNLELTLLANCVLEGPDFEPGPTILWGWDGETWRRVDDEGPMARALAGVAYDTRRARLVMTGGRSMVEDFLDLWIWDGRGWRSSNEIPGTVSNHFSMVYDPDRDRIVMYGGQDLSQTIQRDTWEFDGTAWTRAATTGPSLRVHYALTYDTWRREVLLLGEGPDELWAWDGRRWSRQGAPGAQPPMRAGGRMAFDAARGQAVLMGGYVYGPNGYPLGDTWLWNGAAWTEYTGPGPTARSHHAMAYDAEREVMVLYGGYAGGTTTLNDTWEWDGAEWRCVAGCRE